MRIPGFLAVLMVLALPLVGFVLGRHSSPGDAGATIRPPELPLAEEVSRLERRVLELQERGVEVRLVPFGPAAEPPAEAPEEGGSEPSQNAALIALGSLKQGDQGDARQAEVLKIYVATTQRRALALTFRKMTQQVTSTLLQATAKQQIRALAKAVRKFLKEQARLPYTLEELTLPAENRPAGYLKSRDLPLDPWGNPYVYAITGGLQHHVLSTGPDGAEGTEDDIRK